MSSSRSPDENAQRVFAALARYGAPLAGLTPKDFQDPYSGYQLGLPPSQIDLIFAISAVSFEEAWRDSVPGQSGEGIPVDTSRWNVLFATSGCRTITGFSGCSSARSSKGGNREI